MLRLDCKTRWTSLLTMLKDFYEFLPEIKFALSKLKETFELTEDDIVMMKELIDILSVLEWMTLKLCQRDASLLSLEHNVAFAINQFRKIGTPMADIVRENFEKRCVIMN